MVDEEQKAELEERLRPYRTEIGQCTLQPKRVQVVLNDEVTNAERGQEVLDILVEVLHPYIWSTDLFPSQLNGDKPPEVYSRYKIGLPYVPYLE